MSADSDIGTTTALLFNKTGFRPDARRDFKADSRPDGWSDFRPVPAERLSGDVLPVRTGTDAAGFDRATDDRTTGDSTTGDRTTGYEARFYRNGLKRFLDLTLIVMVSLPVALVIGLLAVMVASQGGRPFYRQVRVGQGGRLYTMWKLRSMVEDADTLLDAYLQDNPDARAEWASDQKLRNDPRITRLGQFLRKYSLDELPQLWNVLRGDMSLVGPRPMMPGQQALYPGTAYYRLRPGITGPWQVSGRNATTFADRARFDALYDRTVSLATDLRLLLATVRVVLRGTGC